MSYCKPSSPRSHFSQNGFTLVELAIVLMIIGLLISGILRGQELIENAKVKATVQQVNSYQAAVTTFRDAYSAMPGDLPTATARLPNCSATTFCTNGNGNGFIGTPIQWVPTDVSGTGAYAENAQFWKHMALTHLISGVTPSSDPASNVAWGGAYPASKYSGGFQIFFEDKDGDPTRPNWFGHMLRMQVNVSGPTTELPGQYAISPKLAARIDRLMDDGLPGTGDVMAFDAAVNGNGSGSCEGGNNGTTAGKYDENSEFNNCTMLFKMGI